MCARCAEEKYGRYFDESARGSTHELFYHNAEVCAKNMKSLVCNVDWECRARATRRAKKQQMRAKLHKKKIQRSEIDETLEHDANVSVYGGVKV